MSWCAAFNADKKELRVSASSMVPSVYKAWIKVKVAFLVADSMGLALLMPGGGDKVQINQVGLWSRRC